MFSNAIDVLYITVCISGISSLVATLEWLYLYRQFRDDGLYSWKIMRISKQLKVSKLLLCFLDFAFKYPNLLIILVIQLLTTVSLAVPEQTNLSLGIECAIIASCYFLITYRGVNGFNGADSTTKIIFTAASICYLSDSMYVIKAGLFFMTLQLVIAYSTPGWLRLFNKNWHNGFYLRRILRLQTFSRFSVWNTVRTKNKLLILLSWQLIAFESLFALALLLPTKVLFIFLSIGILFHVINAIIMGLNTFVWSFLGIYPAFIWTSMQLQKYFF
jgi:hypothetical protein